MSAVIDLIFAAIIDDPPQRTLDGGFIAAVTMKNWIS